jgi:NADH dehydrogenase
MGPDAKLPHVVIVGGGFAGLNAARQLRKAPVRVTVVDRRNHHVFQPLLYQVATAGLNPADIAAPIRSVLRKQKNASVLLADVVSVDTAGKRLVLADGELAYDHLVIATGATHSYFGHDEWAKVAPGLKTLEDAVDIRRRVLLAYEAAERETDPARRAEWMTFVVVGGGPTGVELAGALAEIARGALARDFRKIDPSKARVVLIEGEPRVLPPYPEKLSASAQRQLEKLGVEVQPSRRVTSIDAHGVNIGSERLGARTVVWAAGVAASPLARTLGVPLDRAGRVLVGPHLEVPGREDAYVVGDLAAVERADGKGLVPGVAPAAIQEGKYVAKLIIRRVQGEPLPEPFRYLDKGSLATIGRAAAVADIGKLQLSGFLAWLAWGLIHVLFLIGFRNRFLVMFEWSWQYVTFQRGARLITGPVGPLELAAAGSSPSRALPETSALPSIGSPVAQTAPAPAPSSSSVVAKDPLAGHA